LTDEDPPDAPAEASMAKLAATELSKRCALEAVQMAGGYGYSSEYPMERHLRTARGHHDLRRHIRDPEEHHRQDAGSLVNIQHGHGPLKPCAFRSDGDMWGP
jgi:alkylation response protein AidB-like acyl-CoA dehydrogenase